MQSRLRENQEMLAKALKSAFPTAGNADFEHLLRQLDRGQPPRGREARARNRWFR